MVATRADQSVLGAMVLEECLPYLLSALTCIFIFLWHKPFVIISLSLARCPGLATDLATRLSSGAGFPASWEFGSIFLSWYPSGRTCNDNHFFFGHHSLPCINMRSSYLPRVNMRRYRTYTWQPGGICGCLWCTGCHKLGNVCIRSQLPH